MFSFRTELVNKIKTLASNKNPNELTLLGCRPDPRTSCSCNCAIFVLYQPLDPGAVVCNLKSFRVDIFPVALSSVVYTPNLFAGIWRCRPDCVANCQTNKQRARERERKNSISQYVIDAQHAAVAQFNCTAAIETTTTKTYILSHMYTHAHIHAHTNTTRMRTRILKKKCHSHILLKYFSMHKQFS